MVKILLVVFRCVKMFAIRQDKGWSTSAWMQLLVVSGWWWLATIHGAMACAAGWESPRSLLARSRCVVQVEVVRVEDAPDPAEGAAEAGADGMDHILASGDGEERKSALASVKLLKVLKGTCGVDRFNLLGGPYYSCAPYPCYWNFERGDRLILTLDRNIPAEVSTLRITWRSRVTHADEDEMRSEMVATRGLWKTRLARHRAQDPESFAEAQKLADADRAEWHALGSRSFAVLAGLKMLVSDPGDLPESPVAIVEKGVMETLQRGQLAHPAELGEAMKKRLAEAPDEVRAYNRGIFRRFLLEELFLPEELADRLLRHEAFDESFLASDFVPESCRMQIDRRAESGSEIEALHLLLALADPTGDIAVWRLFAVGSETKVRPEVVLPWLRRNLDREFENWGALQLLMGLGSKELLPLISRHFEENRNSSRLAEYFRFFLAVDEQELAVKAMERSLDLTVQFAGDPGEEEIRERRRKWMRSNLDGLQEVLDEQRPPRPRLEQKLKDLREQVDGVADVRWSLDLSGTGWQMEGIRPGQGVEEGFHEHRGEICPGTFNWNAAQVPGDVYTDLWRAGEIDDPHYGRNGMRAKWVMEKEWWYRCQFVVPEEREGDRFLLEFDGVDYACEVWMNGVRLGRHEGMFSPFTFDVSELVRFGAHAGGNGLVVKLDPPPRDYRQVAGRKFPWHGDYWRTIVPIGIWKPVRLRSHGAVRIVDVHPKASIHADGSATVEVVCELAGEMPEQAGPVTVRAVVLGHGFEAGPFVTELGISGEDLAGPVVVPVQVPEARLWWPWELGEPSLYRVNVSVAADGGVWDDRERRFGIREIRMERNPGYSEEEVQHPWTLRVNGKRLFLRSANWGGPPDIFYGRNSTERYRDLIGLAREANINNLRIFGWHPTEVEAFYDLCDEAGITVWQDLLPIASVILPTDEAFREATFAEAEAAIKTLRRHPCLVLLEGGEESFYGFRGLESNARFLLDLEWAIRPHTDLPYVPTSPLDWPKVLHELGLGKPKDSAHTHKLFYTVGQVLMEDEIPTWDVAVIPEFAVSSAPNVESIRKFIPPEEVWPPGPSWGHHWADLDIFRNLNFQVFGDERTGSLEEFVAGTQVAQGTIFQFGIEHMRRRKPKSSAISICHFITYAPDMKWGIVDYFRQTKRSYEFVKRAYQPLLASLKIDKRRWRTGETFRGEVWIVNDLDRDIGPATLRVQVTGAEGEVLADRSSAVAEILADRSERHMEFEWLVSGKVEDGFRIDLKLLDDRGGVLSQNHYDLLHGDQDEARKECERRALEWQEMRRGHPKADYLRFFPGLSGPERDGHFGDDPPAATGF